MKVSPASQDEIQARITQYSATADFDFQWPLKNMSPDLAEVKGVQIQPLLTSIQ
jgi:hypothetical protein